MSTTIAAGSAPPRAHVRGVRRVRRALPAEHSLLVTATLCLLAAGMVMVYSASSSAVLSSGGSSSGLGTMLTFVGWGVCGLLVMAYVAKRGATGLREATGPLLATSFVLLVAVKLPGLGHSANGAQRWIGAGPLRFEPSELMKLALVLYAAHVLASRREGADRLRIALKRLCIVAGAACLLVYSQPDLGTTLVIALTLAAMAFASGVPVRLLGCAAAGGVLLVLVLCLASPYQAERLTAFLSPAAHATSTDYQAYHGELALGSGGLLGRGPGGSVQKDLYLPNASTDFILAVIGEELGAVGVCGLLLLYGLIAYAGLNIARRAREPYTMLIALGVTALIVSQAVLNTFAVLSLAPVTGVPLPFVSYGSSDLLVMLAAMGLLLGVARDEVAAPRLLRRTGAENTRRSDDGQESDDRDRGGRYGGARGAGARSRGRAARARR